MKIGIMLNSVIICDPVNIWALCHRKLVPTSNRLLTHRLFVCILLAPLNVFYSMPASSGTDCLCDSEWTLYFFFHSKWVCCTVSAEPSLLYCMDVATYFLGVGIIFCDFQILYMWEDVVVSLDDLVVLFSVSPVIPPSCSSSGGLFSFGSLSPHSAFWYLTDGFHLVWILCVSWCQLTLFCWWVFLLNIDISISRPVRIHFSPSFLWDMDIDCVILGMSLGIGSSAGIDRLPR